MPWHCDGAMQTRADAAQPVGSTSSATTQADHAGQVEASNLQAQRQGVALLPEASSSSACSSARNPVPQEPAPPPPLAPPAPASGVEAPDPAKPAAALPVLMWLSRGPASGSLPVRTPLLLLGTQAVLPPPPNAAAAAAAAAISCWWCCCCRDRPLPPQAPGMPAGSVPRWRCSCVMRVCRLPAAGKSQRGAHTRSEMKLSAGAQPRAQSVLLTMMHADSVQPLGWALSMQHMISPSICMRSCSSLVAYSPHMGQ